MTKKEEVQSIKIKDLLNQLSKGNDTEQKEAVKALKVHGDQTIIEPLLIALVQAPSPEVEGEIIDLLNTIKSTKVPPIIAKALADERFKSVRQIMLASIWNSGLDYRPYLASIVKAGTEGDLLDAVECITIIENIEGLIAEEELFEPILVLKEYFSLNQRESNPKDDILREIALQLQNMNDLL
jgi:hypothetical protein